MAQKAVGGGKEERWGPAARVALRLLGGAAAVLLGLAILSFHPADPQLFDTGAASGPIHNWCGSVGATVGGLLRPSRATAPSCCRAGWPGSAGPIRR